MRNKCDCCGLVKPDLTKDDGWIMQHLHVSANEEDTIRFLTCLKCSHESPFLWLKKLKASLAKETNSEA